MRETASKITVAEAAKLIDFEELARKFPSENVPSHGMVIVVPGLEFDPDWEDILSSQGCKVQDATLRGKAVTLVQRVQLSEVHGPVVLLKISELVLDPKFYPRTSVDRSTVERYAEAMRAGAKFPPIKVGLLEGKRFVVDGFHRVEAKKLLKLDGIDGVVSQFNSERVLFAEAVQANSEHGRAFADADRVMNIQRLQQYSFTVDEIVRIIHVPARKVKTLSVTTPSGKKLCLFVKQEIGASSDLLSLKNSLRRVIAILESGSVRMDDEAEKLIDEVRGLLKKVKS